MPPWPGALGGGARDCAGHYRRAATGVVALAVPIEVLDIPVGGIAWSSRSILKNWFVLSISDSMLIRSYAISITDTWPLMDESPPCDPLSLRSDDPTKNNSDLSGGWLKRKPA